MNIYVEKEWSKYLNANFDKLEDNELLPKLAKELSQNKIVGWFQGRMEFGPRAKFHSTLKPSYNFILT